MKQKDFAYAKLVYDNLCISSDYHDANGVIRPFEYVVAIDDDVISAIWAVRKAREIHRIHGYYPPILCVGGRGILSRHLYETTEAEVLADVCLDLGYPHELVWVQGLDAGKCAADHMRNVAMMVDVSYSNRPRVLFCVTKRQSLVYASVQRNQQPYIDAGWFVINEPLKKACKLMNAKWLCGGALMLHELAGILPRYDKEAGFAEKPLVMVSPDVREAADYLAKRYRLKLHNKNLRSHLQYGWLLFNVLLNKSNVMFAIANAVDDEKMEEEP